jgi:anti-sigma regulatory factor (Ser/Thr protein kinase)
VAIERTLPADTSAPRVARHVLRLFGASNLNSEVVVSELVTNAVVHGALPIVLTIERTDGTVHVEVRDERGDFGPRSPRAHGLQLVEAFALGWGVDRIEGDGKTVWANVAA